MNRLFQLAVGMPVVESAGYAAWDQLSSVRSASESLRLPIYAAYTYDSHVYQAFWDMSMSVDQVFVRCYINK